MDEKFAAAYIRVSTEDQVEYSPQSQLEKIRDYAQKIGYSVPEELVFMDEGISGKSTKKRDGFNRMICAAKEKPRRFDTILVWKFSRFARNREDSIVYKSMLRKELGIRVISVSEDVGDDKMSVLFESMIEAMDEYYSINLAEEVKRGMTERIRRGQVCAVAPFGYFMENKKLVVKEDEAEIIRGVFEAFAGGESMVSIARRLNNMGICTHRGGKIENRTVEYWLNNPVYSGKVRWNPNGKTPRYHWNDSGIIVTDGEHEPIVENELWERVQQRILSEKRPKRRVYEGKSPSGYLVGIFKCGICGGAMVNCGGYFYCGNKIKGTCAGNGGVNAEQLEQAVAEVIKNIAYHENINIRASGSGNDYSVQLEKAQKKLLRIRTAYEEGIDTLEEYQKSKKRITEQIELLKKESTQEACGEVKERCITDILLSESTDNAQKAAAARCVIYRIVKTGREDYDIFLNFRCMEDQTEN
ncbi:MAG: recombinase family protein [Clostridia bacterium]|nr:recombinase family protein [Clostridia bacterium]